MADIALCLQRPGEDSGQLLEVLLGAAGRAERAGGIFAFATADGIKALLGDDSLKTLLRAGRFTLVVGVDAVTDNKALDELDARSKQHPRLIARVLVHEQRVLFHPKFSWFVSGRELTLIVGSGNLTVRGLRENWEAFTTIKLTGRRAKLLEGQIDSWLLAHAASLRLPGDATARLQAARNRGRELDLKHPSRSRKRDVVPVEAGVLVAEVPMSGTRPSQVNFDKANYETFFGAKEGSEHRVTLYWVRADGGIETEIRPIMIRKSRNFSFELSGFREPRSRGQSPDIGVYVQLSPDAFFYQRVSSGEAGYAELDRLLKARWNGSARLMRRVVVASAEARAAWPVTTAGRR